MLKNTRSDKIKPTAAEIIHFADAVVENDFKDSIKMQLKMLISLTRFHTFQPNF